MTERTVVVRLMAEVAQFRSSMAQAEAATRRLDAEVAATTSRLNAHLASTGAAAGRSANAFGGAMRTIRSTAMMLGVPLAIGAVTKSWMDFERQMAHVRAVAPDAFGRSALGMQKLRDVALSVGAQYGFTATEVGQAQEALAKAGRSTSQILGGELNSAMILAAAGTIKLDEAANILAVTLTQFKDQTGAGTGLFLGKGGLDAAKVANELAKAANATVSDVSEMGVALKYVGPLAAGLGVSFEDTVTTISMFNQAGLNADMAGTNMRGMLVSLLSPSAMARKEMDKLGLVLFDNNNKFVGMREMAERLSKTLGKLNPKDQADAIGRLATNAQIPGFVTMIHEAGAGFDRMEREIAASANASDVARDKLHSLAGEFSKFGAEVNNSAIKTMSNLDGVLTGTVHTLATVSRGFGDMGGAAQAASLAVAGLLIWNRRAKLDTDGAVARQARGIPAIMGGRGTVGQAPGLGGVNLITQVRAAQARAAQAESALRVVSGSATRMSTAEWQARQALPAAGMYAGLQQAKMKQFASVTGDAAKNLERTAQAAGQSTSLFGGLGRAAKNAGGALLGAFGGVPGLAIIGGLTAFSVISSDMEKAEAEAKNLRVSLFQLGEIWRSDPLNSAAMAALATQDENFKRLIADAKSYGFTLDEVASATGGDAVAQKSILTIYQGRVDREAKALLDAAPSNDFAFLGDLFGSDDALDKASERYHTDRKHLEALRDQFELRRDIDKIVKEGNRDLINREMAKMGLAGSVDTTNEALKGTIQNLAIMNATDAEFDKVIKAMSANVDILAGSFLSVGDAASGFFEVVQKGIPDSFVGETGTGKNKHTFRQRPTMDFVTGQFNVRNDVGRQEDAAARKAAGLGLEFGKTTNTQALLDMDAGFKGVGAAALVAVDAVMQARRAFVDQEAPLVGGREKAERLADAYGLLVDKFGEQIGAPAALIEAVHAFDQLGVKITSLPNGEVVVYADTETALRKVVGLGVKVEKDPVTKQVKYTFPTPGELAAAARRAEAAIPDPVPKPKPKPARPGRIGSARSEIDKGQPIKPKPEPPGVLGSLRSEIDKVAAGPYEIGLKMGPTPPPPKLPALTQNIQLQYGPLPLGPIQGPPQPGQSSAPGHNRWGAVHSYMAGGIHAKVGKGDLIHWAEPQTGGEAYIPRRGDAARSKKILDTAAGWFGMRVVPMAGGGIVSMANGGVALPLSDMIGQWRTLSTSGRFEAEDALLSYREALRGIADAQREVAASRRGVDDAKRGVRDAKENIAAIRALPKTERRTNDMRDATEALAEAQQRLDDANRGVADSLQGVTDAMRAASRASAEYQATKVRPFEQLNKGLDLSIKYNAGFIGNLTKLSKRGFGVLANQLLQMGGPEAWKIASDAVRMTNAQLSGTQAKITKSQAQQSTLENMPAMNAIRAAITSGTGYGKLAGSGDFTAEELNRAINLMRPELQKTAAGRALLAAMSGHNETALRGDLRGYAAGGIAPPGTLYRFAEPSTGGEAVIPRFGAGAPALLSKAASWHGLRVSKPGWQDARMVAARPAQVQITVRGEGALSDMIQTTVDGRLVAVQRALTGGRLAG